VNVSQIARSSGLDRKTVRRALAQEAWHPYRRAPAEETVLGPHRAWLVQRAPRVNYSARILFQELRRERGYAGSYPSLREAVRPLRVEAAAASLTQCRFETEPAEQAQAD
jgi:transposase